MTWTGILLGFASPGTGAQSKPMALYTFYLTLTILFHLCGPWVQTWTQELASSTHQCPVWAGHSKLPRLNLEEMAGATSQYVHKGKRGTWTGGGGKFGFPTDYGVMDKIINLQEPQYKMRPGSACEVKVLKNVTITAHFYQCQLRARHYFSSINPHICLWGKYC